MKSYLRLLSIAVALLLQQSVMAQVTARSAFIDAPHSVLPILNNTTRLDMVDYFENGMNTPSANSLNGKSRITELTPESIKLDISDASKYQLAVVPGNDTILVVIATYSTPAPDSKISFYSKDWLKDVGSQVFKAPAMTDWLTSEGKKHSDDVALMVPFVLVGYEYDPSSRTLKLTNNTASFLSDDVNDMVSGWLKPQITYRWNGKKFEPVK